MSVVSRLVARPFGKIENMRQNFIPFATKRFFVSSSSGKLCLFTQVMASYENAPGCMAANDDTSFAAESACSNERGFLRSQLCASSGPSMLILTERSPALSSEENLSDVSNIPFVTIPHGKPRAVISLPTDSRSLRRSGSPPVMQIITVCGSTCCFISSSAFKKSDGSMSGIDASFLQSLPQWRQFRLQRKVHSQK